VQLDDQGIFVDLKDFKSTGRIIKAHVDIKSGQRDTFTTYMNFDSPVLMEGRIDNYYIKSDKDEFVNISQDNKVTLVATSDLEQLNKATISLAYDSNIMRRKDGFGYIPKKFFIFGRSDEVYGNLCESDHILTYADIPIGKKGMREWSADGRIEIIDRLTTRVEVNSKWQRFLLKFSTAQK